MGIKAHLSVVNPFDSPVNLGSLNVNTQDVRPQNRFHLQKINKTRIINPSARSFVKQKGKQQQVSGPRVWRSEDLISTLCQIMSNDSLRRSKTFTDSLTSGHVEGCSVCTAEYLCNTFWSNFPFHHQWLTTEWNQFISVSTISPQTESDPGSYLWFFWGHLKVLRRLSQLYLIIIKTTMFKLHGVATKLCREPVATWSLALREENKLVMEAASLLHLRGEQWCFSGE